MHNQIYPYFQTFDRIDHNLLIAKLNAYGFEKQSIKFIYSYFTKRKQRTKVDSVVSSWEMLFSGVPQGSLSGTPLFNRYIYICMYICMLETSIRKNDSLVFNKSLGSKCRKMLSFNKI